VDHAENTLPCDISWQVHRSGSLINDGIAYLLVIALQQVFHGFTDPAFSKHSTTLKCIIKT
jgi:hypothetical protein